MSNQLQKIYAEVVNMYKSTVEYQDRSSQSQMIIDQEIDMYAGEEISQKEKMPIDNPYALTDYTMMWDYSMDYIADNNVAMGQAKMAMNIIKYSSLGLQSMCDEVGGIRDPIGTDGRIAYQVALRKTMRLHNHMTNLCADDEAFLDLCKFEPSTVNVFFDYPEGFKPQHLTRIFNDKKDGMKDFLLDNGGLHISKSKNTVMMLVSNNVACAENAYDVLVAQMMSKRVMYYASEYYGDEESIKEEFKQKIADMKYPQNSERDIRLLKNMNTHLETFIETSRNVFESLSPVQNYVVTLSNDTKVRI